MNKLTIDQSACNSCGICIQSCPTAVIERDAQKYPFIATENEARCISCGHCESVCPENALSNNITMKEVAQSILSDIAITPETLGNYFKTRRSIRNYQSQAVEKNILNEVMDIVRYSPTGTNRQLNQWIIVHDTKVVEQLAKGTIEWMRVVSKMNPEMAGRYNIQSLIDAYDNGTDRICRNAPHIIICCAPTEHILGAVDTVIATTQLELVLPSFGLGSCWAGFLMMALKNAPQLKALVGLDDTTTVHAALMVGYPKFEYYRIPERKVADVKWL